MAVEYFDLFDSENNPLNITKERQLVHLDGDWHRTSQVWILNSKNEVLCNLRSKTKDLFPSYWDLSIGGHVAAGDDYETTALRELNEELGLIVVSKELQFLSDEKVAGEDRKNGLVDREHARLFLYKTDKSVEEFLIQRDEIDQIKYFSIPKLIDVLEEKKFEEMPIIPIKHFFLKTLKCLDQQRYKN